MFRKLAKYSIVLVNAFFALLYVFGLLAAIVPANKFVWFSYFGLVFPILIVINLAFVIFWACNRKWWFLMSFLLLLFTLKPINRTFSIHAENQQEIIEGSEFKIMSYNLAMFTSQKKYDDILKFINETDADIVCLQEFGFYNASSIKQNQILHDFEKKYPYHHLWYKNQRNKFWWGVATFSKFPITNKQKVEYKSAYNISIYSDIKIKNETIRVFNNHLESYRITNSNMKAYHELAENPSNDQLKEVTQTFTTKLSSAYRARAKQAQIIADEIEKSPYYTIACGDFNDVPQSYSYHKIAQGMCDAVTAKKGYNYTYYSFGWWAHIDQMLASQAHFSPISCEVPHVKYSDHYPVVATLGVIKN